MWLISLIKQYKWYHASLNNDRLIVKTNILIVKKNRLIVMKVIFKHKNWVKETRLNYKYCKSNKATKLV